MAVRRVFGSSTDSFYAVDAKGRTAGAAIWSGSKHVVGDNDGVRTLESAYLYKKEK